MRFTLYLLLVSPIPLMAGVITTVNVGIPGSGCSGGESNSGEFTSAASFSCPNEFASASANLFSLNVSGSKSITGIPPVTASASFDYQILVTGTDQAGFLRVLGSFDHTDNILSPGIIQVAVASVLGQGLPEQGNLWYVYIPYVPGVPVDLNAVVRGVAGASDTYQQRGTFAGDLEVNSIFVTAQGTVNPFTDPDQDPMIIRDASWRIVPEPSAMQLALAGFGVILSCCGLARSNRYSFDLHSAMDGIPARFRF